jgi:hypothetical protein
VKGPKIREKVGGAAGSGSGSGGGKRWARGQKGGSSREREERGEETESRVDQIGLDR